MDRPAVELARPASPLGWVAFAWGIGGTAAVLLEAVVRLLPQALLLFEEPEPVPLGAAAAWSAFMVWTEGYRGFHQRFNPRVVARAARLTTRPWWSMVLAPLVVMGLLDATRRRLVASWLLVLGIVLLIVLVQRLPEPWRAVVDLGVVLGLSFGTASLAVHVLWSLLGRPARVDPEFAQRWS